MDITRNIKEYMSGRSPFKRYSSFDYCFNYFRDFYERDNMEAIASPMNIQLSCLQIGFYLASSGMLQESSFLLKNSVRYYKELISMIAKMPRVFWMIDVDTYSDKEISLLLEIHDHIWNSFGDWEYQYAPTGLITKIMLGVFGNVPALDDYFCRGFGCSNNLDESLLRKISDYYQANKEEFDKYNIRTVDFEGMYINRFYTKAKLIDMVGFIEGLRESYKENQK